ncbi:MAG: CHASE2 domain-containing protein [Desulfobacteraceae bacterium]|nr:CHASE2 domain-containing protein [Desulfobacteraceae bacterium]
MKKSTKLKPSVISLFAVFIVIFAYFYKIPFLEMVELKTIDLRFKSRGSIPVSEDIVLAVVDEKSIGKEGKWAWPRSKLAKLVTKLSEAGARVIAFDITFAEPDENDKWMVQTVESIKDEIKDLGIWEINIDTYLDDLKLKAANDKLLAEAIKNSNAKVVAGYFFHMDYEGPSYMEEKDIRLNENNISGSMYQIASVRNSMGLFEATAPQANISIISDVSDYSGFFNMTPDTDGVARRVPAVINFNDTMYAPMSLVTASAFLESPLSINADEHGVISLKLGDLPIPTDENGRIMVNYRGDEKSYPHVSVTDILNGYISNDVLKDKIVIVGVTSIGVYDLRVTPFSEVFPGVEIHANIVDNILSNDFLHQPFGLYDLFAVLAIIAAVVCLGFVLLRTGIIFGAMAGFSMFTGYIMLCQHMFSKNGIVLNLVYPLSTIVFIYVCVTSYKYIAESKQKKFIKNTFATYLAPSVVEYLIKSPEKLVLGGEERIITAFFSDVQGFTSISEKLAPKELVELLNEFLTEMTDIILKYEGTVDKFEGDAIIAFFGAPNDLDNQAEAACMACIDMQKRLAELREKWIALKKPALKMRIGLCTGAAIIGNMGSKSRMDYTMMGDTVNTAARLEGVNKVYGTYVMVSETTFSATFGRIAARELDSINVVGKKEPVKIYELLGYSHEVDDDVKNMTDQYVIGLYAYKAQDWDKAIKFFKKALDIAPDDGPSKTMLQRCDEFKLNPPGKGWDGSFSMKSK